MPSVPHPTGPAQVRAAIYLRVSSREQVEGYSLDAQRRANRDYCTARGYTIVAEYADEGITARSDMIAKRPGFARALADAEARQYDILVVHKMDRVARNLKITIEVFERIGVARAALVSVSEPDLDYSTPQGRLFLQMLGALAEWYSRNLAEETKKGWAERKRQGLYAGRLPFGTVKGPDGVPVADTTPFEANGRPTSNHEALLLAFERAAEGATDSEVAEALNAAGYRPLAHARRARFTRDATRTILHNRFYVGELPMGKRGGAGWLQGAHEAIVPEDIFETVQRQRSKRATQRNPHKVNKGAQVQALTGLARCAECGEPMHLAGQHRLTCWGRRLRDCQAPTVFAHVIEAELGAYLRDLQIPEDARRQILEAYQHARPEATERERERQAVEGKLRRLTDVFVLGEIERGDYEAQRIALRAELARLQESDAHGRPEILERLQSYLQSAGTAWDDADAGQRNRLARALFEAVFVRDRHLAGVRPRSEFQPYLTLTQETATPPSVSSENGVVTKGSGGGLEGIRTPDLQRDRLAC